MDANLHIKVIGYFLHLLTGVVLALGSLVWMFCYPVAGKTDLSVSFSTSVHVDLKSDLLAAVVLICGLVLIVTARRQMRD